MRRALTPEEIREADFNVALRGYDRGEVKAFLEDVAARVSVLRESSEKTYQAVGEELGELLQEAKDVADKILADARTEATALAQNAAKDAAALREDAEAYAKQVREAADTDSASTRAQADEEAASTRARANEEAATTRAQANEEATNTRAEAAQDAEQRVSIADDKVRELKTAEAETRQRIGVLRAELEEVAKTLLHLGGDSSSPIEEQRLEDQIDPQDRVDTVPNGAVRAPVI